MSSSSSATSNKADWQEARLDLAAALRWAARLGLHEGVCNHFSVMLAPDRFLLNAHRMHWSKAKASGLLVIDDKNNVIAGEGKPAMTAFNIHVPLHLKTGHRVVLHTHMPYATALTLTTDRALDTRASQGAMRFHGRIGIDADYNGLALDWAEGERIARAMQGKDVAFLANHGVIVCGASIAHAYDDLYYLERVCMHQVLAMSTGRPLARVSEKLSAHVAAQIQGEREQSDLFFEALRRLLPPPQR